MKHIQDFWGDALTEGGAQSADGKAAYVQLSLAGAQGSPESNQSVDALRKVVGRNPAPKGIKTYVTGPSVLAADTDQSADKTVLKIMLATIVVIFITLLFVYRSISTVLVLLAMVGVELLAARGIVAFLSYHDFFRLSTFSTSILVSLA